MNWKCWRRKPSASNMLRWQGINTLGLQTSEYPTGLVTVTVSADGKPAYVSDENVAWDYIRYQPDMAALAGEIRAVCFGSLA